MGTRPYLDPFLSERSKARSGSSPRASTSPCASPCGVLPQGPGAERRRPFRQHPGDAASLATSPGPGLPPHGTDPRPRGGGRGSHAHRPPRERHPRLRHRRARALPAGVPRAGQAHHRDGAPAPGRPPGPGDPPARRGVQNPRRARGRGPPAARALPRSRAGDARRPARGRGRNNPDEGRVSVDRLAAVLLTKKEATGSDNRGRALRLFLGLDPANELDAGSVWPSQTEIAALLGLTRARVSQCLSDARRRWLKTPALTALRAEIPALLRTLGSVATLEELESAVLLARGSGRDEPERSAHAAATRAVDAEGTLRQPAFRPTASADAPWSPWPPERRRAPTLRRTPRRATAWPAAPLLRRGRRPARRAGPRRPGLRAHAAPGPPGRRRGLRPSGALPGGARPAGRSGLILRGGSAFPEGATLRALQLPRHGLLSLPATWPQLSSPI